MVAQLELLALADRSGWPAVVRDHQCGIYRAPDFGPHLDALELAAKDFLRAHPDAWQMFCRYAHELIRSGREHGGAKAIAERIRWDCATSAHRDERLDFVWNNSFTAPIARAFARTYPEHADFFRFRGAAAPEAA